MNRKKQKLIEIFFFTLVFLIFVISFQLQQYVILFLILTGLVVVITYKNEIKKNFLQKKTNSLLKIIYLDIFIVILLTILFSENFNSYKMESKNYFFIFFLLLLYLLFSVIPQEIIFRFLFFHKYECYFNNIQILIINSLAFSLCHLIYFDMYIFFFSFFGNILFTCNYIKNKSLLLVIIEHFIIGQTIIFL